jgi:hypothetical protein
VSRNKVKKTRMTQKQVNRALQRMQTYVNDLTTALNRHQPDKDEALASVFVVAVRCAKLKQLSLDGFLAEAESAWENLKRLPIDGDKIEVVDAEVVPTWRVWIFPILAVTGWAAAAVGWAL